MREYIVVFREGLVRGLRTAAENARNIEALVDSQGAVPRENCLQTLDDFNQWLLDTTGITTSFPYPQLFVLSNMVLVCTEDTIYKQVGSSWELQLTVASVGCTWTVADYHDFIVMTNGSVLVVRSPETHAFTAYAECDIPNGICVCDVNGQMLIGGPGVTVSEGFTGV